MGPIVPNGGVMRFYPAGPGIITSYLLFRPGTESKLFILFVYISEINFLQKSSRLDGIILRADAAVSNYNFKFDFAPERDPLRKHFRRMGRRSGAFPSHTPGLMLSFFGNNSISAEKHQPREQCDKRPNFLLLSFPGEFQVSPSRITRFALNMTPLPELFPFLKAAAPTLISFSFLRQFRSHSAWEYRQTLFCRFLISQIAFKLVKKTHRKLLVLGAKPFDNKRFHRFRFHEQMSAPFCIHPPSTIVSAKLSK
jgi:hypothetical protein